MSSQQTSFDWSLAVMAVLLVGAVAALMIAAV